VLAADLIVIATPDRAIAETAEALARIGPGLRSQARRNDKGKRSGGRQALQSKKRTGSNTWRGKIVLHTSGALGSDILRPLALRGAAIGSLHPLQTFSGRTPPSLAGLTCAIEGSAAALRMAHRICRELDGIPVALSPRQKAAYHAAAALSAGHILAVTEAAVRILMSAGFPRTRASRALLSLTRQTLANYERVGPRAAWTGPLSRGDFGVIERHLEALRRFPREYREAYDALSRLGVTVLANRRASKRRQLEQTLARTR
jgi:predicted short-subunit dehydrogenase-like oxidoreductase (DUF2520 family)